MKKIYHFRSNNSPAFSSRGRKNEEAGDGGFSLEKRGSVMEVAVKNKTTETQLQGEINLFGEDTEPRCANDCGKSMRAYRGNRLYCDECLPIVDKRRRKERRELKERESAERTEKAWREYRTIHTMFYLRIRDMALKALYDGHIVFSVRGAFYILRANNNYKIPNAFSRYCALDLIADHPELEGLIVVKK